MVPYWNPHAGLPRGPAGLTPPRGARARDVARGSRRAVWVPRGADDDDRARGAAQAGPDHRPRPSVTPPWVSLAVPRTSMSASAERSRSTARGQPVNDPRSGSARPGPETGHAPSAAGARSRSRPSLGAPLRALGVRVPRSWCDPWDFASRTCTACTSAPLRDASPAGPAERGGGLGGVVDSNDNPSHSRNRHAESPHILSLAA